MNETHLEVGSIIRDALIRQYTHDGLYVKARKMQAIFDDVRAEALGNWIAQCHRREGDKILAEVREKAAKKRKGFRALLAVLSANAEVQSDMEREYGEGFIDFIESSLRVQNKVLSATKSHSDILKPSRQNVPATTVAIEIAHLFRQFGLTPSAAKRGAEPSSIFGKCVEAVFLALGEKANWRRAAETAVEKGEEYQRDFEDLQKAFKILVAMTDFDA
ncbi:hypothetical protein KUV51_13875 [Tateyamaria omphalii]|uniref:hypothetical protein n=1 Tax=Tateyamaria omphalii TaxID=299262 RepID=UPI001C99D26D|nr:hypothetical protein [Tateyamaria omphalii]MBY5934092.1 hypothetical protein [Tateyamaria omphalii]